MTRMNKDYTEVQLQIIEAARKLFIKKGFKGTTIRDIAAEAGVNWAMINYYFRSKEDLFNTIIAEAFTIYAKKTAPVLDSELPLFEIIRKLVYALYDMQLEYPDFALLFTNELTAYSQMFSKFDKYMSQSPTFKRISKLINEEKAKGTIHPISAADFMLSFISLTTSPFLATSTATRFLNLSEEQYKGFLNKHKEFVADFIIRAIRKN